MLLNKKIGYALGTIALLSATAVGTFFALEAMGVVDLQEKINLTYTINNENKVYDGKALVPSGYELTGSLIEGHEAKVTFTGSQLEVGTCEASASIKIVDQNNVDVTNKYYIQVVPGELKVDARDIGIRYKDAEIEYSGEYLNYSDFDIVSGSLVDGQRVQPIATGGQEGIGVLEQREIKTLIFDNAGNDVTKNYNIANEGMGKVEIVRRAIAFDLKTHTKVYDGKMFNPDYYISMGSLVKNHHAVVKIADSDRTIDAQKAIKTELDIKIFDENDVDVTNNYFIKNKEVILTIEPRNLMVSLPNLTKVYDGKAFTQANIDKSTQLLGMIPSDEIAFQVKENLLIKDAGTSIITGADIEIIGHDKDNYNISFNNGSLTIDKRKLYIDLPNGSKTYDGETFDFKDLKAYVTKQIKDSKSVIGDFTLKTTFDDKDAGIHPYTFTFTPTTGADNYDVVMAPGFIRIFPKNVTIAVKNVTMTYTGAEVSVGADKNVLDIQGLSVKEIEKLQFAFINNGSNTLINAGNYILAVDPNSLKFVGGETPDISLLNDENINLTLIPGQVTIKPKDVRINAQAVLSKKINTFPFVINEKIKEGVEASGLCSNHKIDSAYAVGTLTTFDESGNFVLVKDVVITDSNGNNVNANYNIIYTENAKVKIEPAEIFVNLGDLYLEVSSTSDIEALVKDKIMTLAISYIGPGLTPMVSVPHINTSVGKKQVTTQVMVMYGDAVLDYYIIVANMTLNIK